MNGLRMCVCVGERERERERERGKISLEGYLKVPQQKYQGK